jgi:hypothetical protein
MLQNAADLVLTQGDGKALRPFSPLDILESAKLFVENMFIEKNDGIQGLILGGCGDILLGGQMGEKGSYFRFSHFLRVAFMMKKDILENPANITFFGLVAIMSGADDIAHVIEEFFLCHHSLLPG